MGFFDKVKDTASVVADKAKKAGSDIGNASKTAIEKQKLKGEIRKEDANIEKQYALIGKKYIELFANQYSPEFAEYVQAIETSKENINKLNAQLVALEDFVICSCGTKVAKNASYCPNCGSAIAVATTTAEEQPTVAPEEVVVDDTETSVSNDNSSNL
ncbi:MAG: zinc ribbon domain-containing protein [Oscillospiraceae bacterium]